MNDLNDCNQNTDSNDIDKLKTTTKNVNKRPTEKSIDKPFSSARSTAKKPKPTQTPSRQDQATLSLEIGLRMLESRKMAGLSQIDAARRFGYSNPSKLSKVEKGVSPQIPIWLIRKAAIVYDVSCDYLFGVTATMERDDVEHAALRELHAFLYAEFDKRNGQNIVDLAALRQRLIDIESMIVLADLQGDQLMECANNIIKQKAWLEIKGGNKLYNCVDRLCHTIKTSSKRYKDIRREMRVKSGTEYQMNLLLDV